MPDADVKQRKKKSVYSNSNTIGGTILCKKPVRRLIISFCFLLIYMTGSHQVHKRLFVSFDCFLFKPESGRKACEINEWFSSISQYSLSNAFLTQNGLSSFFL